MFALKAATMCREDQRIQGTMEGQSRKVARES